MRNDASQMRFQYLDAAELVTQEAPLLVLEERVRAHLAEADAISPNDAVADTLVIIDDLSVLAWCAEEDARALRRWLQSLRRTCKEVRKTLSFGADCLVPRGASDAHARRCMLGSIWEQRARRK